MSPSSSHVNAAKGFTLIEVMVAMAIVALAISALLYSAGKHVENSTWLREKMLAQWVALNVLQEAQLKVRISKKFPDENTSGETRMANQDWQWRMSTIKTDDKNILQLHVEIFTENNSENVIASVHGYVDNYSRLTNIGNSQNGLGSNNYYDPDEEQTTDDEQALNEENPDDEISDDANADSENIEEIQNTLSSEEE